MSFFYEDVLRLDWGFGNPNRTAALIGMLMLLSWTAAYFWRRVGFWISLLLFTGLGLLLVQTFSRGGVLALACGAIVLALCAPRPWKVKPAILIGISIGVLCLYAFVLSATDRIADSWQGDRSVLNRLELWKHVPSMIADAPGGWGWGESQIAYMNWYQPVDRTERPLNLISLHFTLLAETPWIARFFYVALWLFATYLAWPTRGISRHGIALSVLVAFFVAGLFTHFGDSWPVYLPPAGVIAFLLGKSLLNRQYRISFKAGFVLSLATAMICLLIFSVGKVSSRLPIRGDRDSVVIGNGSPELWAVVDHTVMGNQFGKIYRQFLEKGEIKNRSVGFVRTPAALPDRTPIVAFGPLNAASLQAVAEKKPQRLILLNSPLYPVELQQLFPTIPVTPYFGEFNHSPSAGLWSQTDKPIVIPGAGEYLPQWPSLLLAKQSPQ